MNFVLTALEPKWFYESSDMLKYVFYRENSGHFREDELVIRKPGNKKHLG